MPADQLISFGPYQLDRASGRLLRGGTNVPLRRKTFAVLEYLATRPGCLVAKHELLDAVWPATHVSPSVLAGCIRELRQALGDDARAARFIETAHRRGYRFIAASSASVAPLEDAAPRTVSRVLGREAELADLARRFAQAVAGVVERGRRESDARAGRGAARGPRRAPSRKREKGGGRRVR